MKKLMIAAAIVCVAAMSQASSFKWTSDNKIYIDNTDPSTWTDGQVITPLTSGTKGYMDSSLYSAITWSAVMDLTYGGDTETLNITPLFSSHKINNASVDSTLFSLPTDDSGKDYSWSVVLTGTWKDAEGNDWTITSNPIVGSKTYSKLTNEQISFGSPTSWTVTGAVPEPTSGLLMLLGVAGLALRRRRA